MNNLKGPPRLVDYSSDEELFIENDCKKGAREILAQNNSEQTIKNHNVCKKTQNEWCI